MKKTVLLLGVIGLSLVVTGQDEIPMKSKIEKVTVFLKGAQVERKAAKTLNSGTTYLKFTNLSPNINPSSVQVKATGEVTILSVKHQRNYLVTDTKPIRIQALEDSLEILQMRLDLNRNMESVYKEEKSLILSNKSIKGEQTGLDVEELEYTADFFRERLPEIMENVLKLKSKRKKIQKRYNKVRNQLSELNAQWKRSTGEVIVELSANARVSSRFELSYLVSNASWAPAYDLRAKDNSSPIILNYKANVHQNTGVDWNKVKLVLSTGNPTLSGTKPQLVPWVLSFQQPYRAPESKATYKLDNRQRSLEAAEEMDMPMMTDDETLFKEEIPAATTADFTNVVQGQVNTEFVIQIPYTVPTDNKNHLVNIQNAELPATFIYFAAPKADLDAFLLARVTGWDEYNLLSGYANLYFEGTYIGRSYINANTTKDTLDLSFGRDKSVVVTRKKIKDYTKKSVIGPNKKETIGIEITVRNTKGTAIEMQLKDQIPISSNKEIQVELLDKGGSKLEERTGYLKWDVHIEPSETKTYVFKYSVTFPKNKTIYNF